SAAPGAGAVAAAGRGSAAGCFLADAMADAGGEAGVVAGAAAAGGCFAAPAADCDGRCAFADDPVPGSGVMMLTAGVLAELGNSALVGLPVGPDGGRAATGTEAGGGAFHDG